MALVRHLMRHDQMGLGIDHALDIVADMPAVLRTRRHGPGVWIGQRYLPVGDIDQGLPHGQKAFDLLADAAISASQMNGPFGPRLADSWRSILSASSI